MLESKRMVPKTYAKSRDYKAILKLLDLLICSFKSDCDNLSKIFNPMLCPIGLLPSLGSYVGYKYDIKESQYANRLIIKYYQSLIRNRGSLTGIKLAVALAINAYGEYDIDNISLFDIYYDRDKNIIYVYVYGNNYINKIYDLIEVVRPAGTKCEVIVADSIGISEQIDIYDNITCIAVYNYNPEIIDSQTVNNFTVSIGNYKLIIDYEIPEHKININNPEEIIINDAVTEGSYKFRTDDKGFIRGYKIDTTNENDPNMNIEISTPYFINENGDMLHGDIESDNNNLYDIVMSKNYIDNFIITDRFKVGIRNRVGFGEVYDSKVNIPTVYINADNEFINDDKFNINIKDGSTKKVIYNINKISKFKVLNGNSKYRYIKLAEYDSNGNIISSYDTDKSYRVEISINNKLKTLISSGDLYITILPNGEIKCSNISFNNIFNITGDDKSVRE